MFSFPRVQSTVRAVPLVPRTVRAVPRVPAYKQSRQSYKKSRQPYKQYHRLSDRTRSPTRPPSRPSQAVPLAQHSHPEQTVQRFPAFSPHKSDRQEQQPGSGIDHSCTGASPPITSLVSTLEAPGASTMAKQLPGSRQRQHDNSTSKTVPTMPQGLHHVIRLRETLVPATPPDEKAAMFAAVEEDIEERDTV